MAKDMSREEWHKLESEVFLALNPVYRKIKKPQIFIAVITTVVAEMIKSQSWEYRIKLV